VCGSGVQEAGGGKKLAQKKKKRGTEEEGFKKDERGKVGLQRVQGSSY